MSFLSDSKLAQKHVALQESSTLRLVHFQEMKNQQQTIVDRANKTPNSNIFIYFLFFIFL